MEISYNLCNLASDVVAVWQEEENGSLVEKRTPIAKAVCYADGTRSGVVNPANRGWLSRYVGSLICDGDAEFLCPVGIQTSDGYIPWDDSDTSRTQYFLRDHLGSIRVVATDKNTVIRRDDYLPFGERMTGNGLPDASNRSSWFGFSGKENEMWPVAASTATSQPNIPHWSVGQRYQHFGARAYDPYTCSFMQVDPMAEKYYGISPYSYCAGNPAMYVDPDGEAIETGWDILNVGLGIKSFIENIKQGNILGAVIDGGGVLYDLAAVAVPGLPAGASTGIKAARAADKAVDVATQAGKAIGSAKIVDDIPRKYSSIPNPRNAGSGKGVTKKQKKQVLEMNRQMNGGVLRSDRSGDVLDVAQKSVKGQKANMNQAEIDHIIPKSKGGTNENSNLQVLSKRENLEKSNKW